jgi:hypothetical protein
VGRRRAQPSAANFRRRYLPVESDGIPGGDLQDVAQTSFDFRTPKTVAADFLTMPISRR